MSTIRGIDYIALADEALTHEGSEAYFGATVAQLGTFLATHPNLWTNDGKSGWYTKGDFDRALRAHIVRSAPDTGLPLHPAPLPLSLTDADLAAIRAVVVEELASHAEQLHGDLDDPTDGPLDQAALRRHGDAVDLVRQDTQDHCMACGHKGEVAS